MNWFSDTSVKQTNWFGEITATTLSICAHKFDIADIRVSAAYSDYGEDMTVFTLVCGKCSHVKTAGGRELGLLRKHGLLNSEGANV